MAVAVAVVAAGAAADSVALVTGDRASEAMAVGEAAGAGWWVVGSAEATAGAAVD
jgi:hypothetical protein